MSPDEFMEKMEGKPSPTYDQWNHDDQRLKHDVISDASDETFANFEQIEDKPLSVTAGFLRG